VVTGRPLRVGLVCPYDFDVPGGVREQVLGIARAVAEGGVHAEVLAPRRRGAPRREQVDGVVVVSAGPAVGVPINGSTARLALDPRARRRAARWASSGFDVVHVHEPLSPGIGHTVLRGLAADRELGLPGPAVVATVHVSLDARPAGRSRSLRSASRLVRGLLRNVDLLSAVSELARHTVVDHLGRVPLVVPNGVDVASWPSPGSQPDTGSRPPAVVVLGRAAEPRKGVDVLLRAWPRVRLEVPAAELFVVGPAEGLRVGGGHGVHLLGAVGEAMKRRVVSGADLLVAPHRGGESFGIVLVEAMAAGTPVVASDLPAFRAVLAGHGTLVPPGDPVALGDAVVDALVRGATLEDRLAQRRRAEEFDWSVVGRRWRGLYATALRVRDGRGETWLELAEAVAERARRATDLAGAAMTEQPPGTGPAWRDLLLRAAADAADPADEAAQSRLTAVARDPRLPRQVRRELWLATARVRDTRALVNDLARRDGAPTVEFDDGAEDGTDGWADGPDASGP
jgi:phosphatidyl-myo-inositol alpha-mannosyltransferase